MKTQILTSILILLGLSIYSQDTTSKSGFYNEFYVDLQPVFATVAYPSMSTSSYTNDLFSDGNSVSVRWTLGATYKRRTDKNKAVTFNVNYILFPLVDYEDDNINTSSTKYEKKLWVRAGYEWLFGKKRINFFINPEIGYYYNKIEKVETEGVFSNNVSNLDIYNTRTFYHELCLGVATGLRIDISKRFSLLSSLRVGVKSGSKRREYSQYTFTTSNTSSYSTSIGLNTWGSFNFQLGYRF